MPDRIIRDELLQSERWLSLPSDTCRVAYLALLLSADALGDLPATPLRLYRLLRDFDNIGDADAAEKIAATMIAKDMIRYYDAEGTRYLHVLRYRQSLRWIRRLFPVSPWATEEEKQRVAQNTPSASVEQTARKPSAPPAHAAEVKRSEVKRYDKKRSDAPVESAPPVDNSRRPAPPGTFQTIGNILSTSKATPPADPPPEPRDDPTPEQIEKREREKARQLSMTAQQQPTKAAANGAPHWSLSEKGIEQKAVALQMPANTGESWNAWRDRLIAADQARSRP